MKSSKEMADSVFRIRDAYIEKPYIVHYEGYGSDEWIYRVRKPSEQDKYLRGD